MAGMIYNSPRTLDDATRGRCLGSMSHTTAKRQSESQFREKEPQLGGTGIGFDRTSGPRRFGIEGFLNDASGGENGTGYDLANLERIEVQAFVEFGGEVLRLRPGLELAELRLDDGAGAIKDRTANYCAITPILRRKGESMLHVTTP